ncbi:MAG: hypothetical protein ACR2NZ_04020 [Rubripirellula sp.]
MRPHRFLATLTLTTLVACGWCNSATAQLTITNPDDDATPQPVRQVSLSTPADIAMAKLDDADRQQLKVTVQYLQVDAETRQAIYATIGPEAIQTATYIPETDQVRTSSKSVAPANSGKAITSASRVTTSILDVEDVADIVLAAQQSAGSNVSNAPSVILLEGKKAELNDVVQRPFIVNMEATEGGPKPIMQVVDEGTRLGIVANLTEDAPSADSIELSCEIVTSRVLDVESDLVFNVKEEAMTVQVPIHQVTTAATSAVLTEGQTLLVDPHVSTTKSVQSETSVPVLGKIPYVGRSFKNVAVGHVEQHMIVLLLPQIEKQSR